MAKSKMSLRMTTFGIIRIVALSITTLRTITFSIEINIPTFSITIKTRHSA